MAAPTKVMYFGVPGRAEATRLAFAIGGIEFENKIIERAEWDEMKPGLAPLLLPLMEVNGKLVSQSIAMLRYACKIVKYNDKPLYPENPLEALLVDELVDQVSEVFPPMLANLYITDAQEQAAKQAETLKQDGASGKWVALIDSVLAQSSTGFAALDRLTMADLMIFTMLGLLRNSYFPGCPMDCVDHLSHLAKHKEKIASLPPVKEYYKDAAAFHEVYKC